MDQDLELTPIQQPPLPEQKLQLSTDEIFKKLLIENQMEWIDVMEEAVAWLDLKFPSETDDKTLLEKFSSFNDFLLSFYIDKTSIKIEK